MLLAVVVLKGLVEVLLLTFIAQGILHVFAGSNRDSNIVYNVFVIINRPVWKATRFITPRFIVDAHVGFVSFFILVLAWLLLVVAKVHLYLEAAKAGA